MTEEDPHVPLPLAITFGVVFGAILVAWFVWSLASRTPKGDGRPVADEESVS